MVSHGEMQKSMNGDTGPQSSFFLQFGEGRMIPDPSDSCFVDSDDEFNIDDFRSRIDSIEAELSEDGHLGHSLVLDDAREAEHFWDVQKERLSSDTAANLLETLENAVETDDLATGSLCESEDEAMRKLVGRDPSLGSLVSLYGLKSDVILSRDKDRSEPGTENHRKGHSLGLDNDVEQFEMTDRGPAEMTSDFYDQPPHLGSDATTGCGDDTMALFYEFQNLSYIDPVIAADDVDSGHHLTSRTKFYSADEIKDGGGFEEDLKPLGRTRKRGASMELSYDDALDNRLLTDSPAYTSSQVNTGLIKSSSQADHFSIRHVTGNIASSFSLPDVTWLRSQANFPPGKRAKVSQNDRISLPLQTDSRSAAIWNSIPSFNSSDSIAFLQALPDAAYVDRPSELGWHQIPNTSFSSGPLNGLETWGLNSDREKFEDKRRVIAPDGTTYSESVSDSLSAGLAPETVWTTSGSLPSFSQFNEAELGHQVTPSGAFSADELTSLQAAWKGLHDASRAISLDAIIASFLDSCPEVAGSGTEKNQHINDSSETPDQVPVTEIRSLPNTTSSSADARRKMSDEIVSGLQGHVTEEPVPCPDNTTDRTKTEPDQRAVSELQRSRLTTERVAQGELADCNTSQSTLPGWSLPTTSGISLPAGSAPLPAAIHGLPFPLPPVPSGYKLVITHQSLPVAGTDSTLPQKETRIIIIHPAQESPSTPVGHQDQNLSGQPSTAAYQSPNPTINPHPHPLHEIAHQKHSGAAQQPGHNPMTQSSGVGIRRPADFDLPQKSSVQHFPRNDQGSKISSPLTHALDLSLNSILAQASNPEQIGSRYHTVQNPAHQTSPSFTNAICQKSSIGIQLPLATSGTHTMTTYGSQILTTSASRIAETACPLPSDPSRVYLSSSQCLFPTRPASGHLGRPGHLSSATCNSPVDAVELSTEGHLVDVMFPPNVVIGQSCCPGGCHMSGRLCNGSIEASSPIAHARRSSFEIGSGGGITDRLSSPTRPVEPDSTVQPGQRDIIRALTDKIRRNRNQRRTSDNLVSTTSQSPTANSADGQSPRSEPTAPSLNQHQPEPAASESTEAPPYMHQCHQQHLTTDALTSRSSDFTVAGKPAQFGIKAELPPSPTSADRPSSVLTTPSAVHHSPLEESGVHGNRVSTYSAESNDQKVSGTLEWSASSNGENSPDRKKSFDGKSITGTDESDLSSFCFFLDAPISTAQRQDEDRITYLNKGQYYRLSLECQSLPYKSENVVFKSVVMVLFRDSRAVGDELEAWKIWHSRQQSYKQRILDIDYKDACGVGLNSMKELAYNATALTWSRADQPVKVNVAVNCLSTDFSNQKGVKGIPLHIQIDTYDVSAPEVPIHRAYCKIKVFCDKGAERKVRDEERKREKRNKVKSETTVSEMQEGCCTSLRQSNFQPVEDLTKEPVFFIPSNDIIHFKPATTEKKTLPTPSSYGYSRNSVGNATDFNSEENQTTIVKRSRPTSIVVSREYQRVLLYVREMQEEVFTALLLQTPTVPALAQAIHEKCNIEASKIRNIYKKSKKGILVKMDDKILRHYSNESTFIITTVTNSTQSNAESIMYDIILAEIDVDTH